MPGGTTIVVDNRIDVVVRSLYSSSSMRGRSVNRRSAYDTGGGDGFFRTNTGVGGIMTEVDPRVRILLSAADAARNNGNWARSDELLKKAKAITAEISRDSGGKHESLEGCVMDKVELQKILDKLRKFYNKVLKHLARK